MCNCTVYRTVRSAFREAARDRPRGAPEGLPAGSHHPPPHPTAVARERTKKIAPDPAESGAINDFTLEGARAWSLLGQAPVVSSCVGGSGLGDPEYARSCWCCGRTGDQASLRCCGIPASSARTSASR